jgi:tetratricopeptide (TPR) repeat protein
VTAETLMSEAAALEAEADEYPDDRGEILLEAARAWRRAGAKARADELMTEIIAAGGEDGCYARFERAEACFEDGNGDEAHAELDRLARDPALHDGHCTIVAELLAEREDLEGALRWYDRAVARLTSEQIDALRKPDGWAQMSSVMIRCRHDVRRRLGLPADTIDDIVLTAPLERPDYDGVWDHIDAGYGPRQVRMLVFQRAERAEARRRWPEEYPASDEDHYPEVERRNRELVDGGVPAVRLVPVTVAALCEFAARTGGSPTDGAVKARYAEQAAPRDVISWPPPRNGPCWCGSGAKYKKCCGRAPL